ncbi:hypothetical protein HPP92_022297 [Vanilla planifolia]|uniref:Uncharacterized protein n=1 Tax=Vanilla planifolia TaxID=51239 RepID=A0A835PR95_VANPL|nr:hypothetical protein HPP92_022297 [Vanilla planifolia]
MSFQQLQNLKLEKHDRGRCKRMGKKRSHLCRCRRSGGRRNQSARWRGNGGRRCRLWAMTVSCVSWSSGGEERRVKERVLRGSLGPWEDEERPSFWRKSLFPVSLKGK